MTVTSVFQHPEPSVVHGCGQGSGRGRCQVHHRGDFRTNRLALDEVYDHCVEVLAAVVVGDEYGVRTINRDIQRLSGGVVVPQIGMRNRHQRRG